MNIRILLVDDHQMILDGLGYIFKQSKSFEVVAKVNSGKEALRILENIKIDIVITDLDMPGMTGLQLIKKIKEEHDGVKIIMLSMHSDTQLVKEVMKSGADGYLLKTSNEEDMIIAVNQVYDGKKYFSTSITESLLNSSNKSTDEKSTLLTEREVEILRLISNGLSSTEIGEQLFISSRTVDTHRTNLMKKLDINNIAGLVRYAIQNKLLD